MVLNSHTTDAFLPWSCSFLILLPSEHSLCYVFYPCKAPDSVGRGAIRSIHTIPQLRYAQQLPFPKGAYLFFLHRNIEFIIAHDGAVEIELIRRGDLAAVLVQIHLDVIGEDADEHLTHRGVVQTFVTLAFF